MSYEKEFMAEKEKRLHNKRQAYTDKILRNETYSLPCPYCGYGLTEDDSKKDQCIHCGYLFKW